MPIGPPPARESYLNIEAIVAAARTSGAEAVHPGYGFLAENAEFAEACAAAGLVFIGPPAAAMRADGLEGRGQDVDGAGTGCRWCPAITATTRIPRPACATRRGRIGFPVLIKAAAGGGGEGMRVVERPRRIRRGARRRPARSGRRPSATTGVLIEKYLARPRHIEVQIFGDRHGNVVHLFERDCSIQRRHQKVIEEAPAPGLDAATAARDAARRPSPRRGRSTMSAPAPSSSFVAAAEAFISSR